LLLETQAIETKVAAYFHAHFHSLHIIITWPIYINPIDKARDMNLWKHIKLLYSSASCL